MWDFEYEGRYYTALSEDGETVTAKSDDGNVLYFIPPREQGFTVEDIREINSINDVLCYIYYAEGRLSVRFALEIMNDKKGADSDDE